MSNLRSCTLSRRCDKTQFVLPYSYIIDPSLPIPAPYRMQSALGSNCRATSQFVAGSRMRSVIPEKQTSLSPECGPQFSVSRWPLSPEPLPEDPVRTVLAAGHSDPGSADAMPRFQSVRRDKSKIRALRGPRVFSPLRPFRVDAA